MVGDDRYSSDDGGEYYTEQFRIGLGPEMAVFSDASAAWFVGAAHKRGSLRN